jgi:hypothetical protein
LQPLTGRFELGGDLTHATLRWLDAMCHWPQNEQRYR